ncbi:MAG TPA: RNA-binding transcriptional accessory protein, partial [Aliarcobacter thereius]
MNLIKILEEKTKLEKTIIENIIKLLEDGCTIPFIARYRKDYTNSATDEQLRKFEDIYEYSKKLLNRKEEIKDILKERGFLDEKTLKDIELSETLTNLEDIYSVFKEKKS